MGLMDVLLNLDLKSTVILAVGLLLLVHVIPYLVDPHAIRGYPGPFVANFTDLWLGRISALGHRSEVVHDLHQKHGESTKCSPHY